MSRDTWMKLKLCLGGAVFAMAFLGIVYRAFTLQVVTRDMLVEKSKVEVERHLNLGAVRGEIFDANGERLAASVAVPSLYIDASVMTDKSGAVVLSSEYAKTQDEAMYAGCVSFWRMLFRLRSRTMSNETVSQRGWSRISSTSAATSGS